jgi:peptidase YpeB-like protein
LSTDAGIKRGLRDAPLGRIALLVAVLLIALLVSKSCGDNHAAVPSREAIDIAKRQIDFVPDGVQIKNVPRSLQQQRAWVVSLYTGTATAPEKCRLVEIDADTGAVTSVRAC